MITGVMLAAGAGSRFGSQKLLATLHGRPLIYHSIRSVLASQLTRLHVVIPATGLASEIHSLFPSDPRIHLYRNPNPGRGIASSLRIGFRSVESGSTGAMILLADMPWVTARIIDDLIREFGRRPGILSAYARETHTHPRIIPKTLFGEFLALKDGETGRTVIERHADDLVGVPSGDPMHFLDVDTPDDLNRPNDPGDPGAR